MKCALTAVLIMIQVLVNGAVPDTTFSDKISSRIAEYLSNKCSLSLTSTNKLKKMIKSNILKRRLCLRTKEHCPHLISELKEEMTLSFGPKVYKEFEKFFTCTLGQGHTRIRRKDRLKTMMLN
jgi:hypothetical protein